MAMYRACSGQHYYRGTAIWFIRLVWARAICQQPFTHLRCRGGPGAHMAEPVVCWHTRRTSHGAFSAEAVDPAVGRAMCWTGKRRGEPQLWHAADWALSACPLQATVAFAAVHAEAIPCTSMQMLQPMRQPSAV